MNAIEIKGLCKAYGDFSLEGLDLCLPEGSIMGLVGENGAGKSTTINLIMNAVKADAGTVRVLGMDNQSVEFSALKNDIGVVLDEAYFPETLNADNVNKIMRYTYRNWSAEQFLGYMQRFGISRTKAFKDFSRGMKMKLAIAVALSHAPRLLILDEATSGLDPIVRDEILDIFNDFTRDERHSVLLSSHIVSDLEKICDYVAFLHRGKLLLCEEKDLLLSRYALVRLTREEFAALPQGAVKGAKFTEYGAEALIERSALPSGRSAEHTGIEDIMLYLTKEEYRR